MEMSMTTALRSYGDRRQVACALAAACMVTSSLAAEALAQVHVPAQVAPVGVKLELPAPTGVYPLGVMHFHLVDAKRQDPWIPGRSRELMISLWYPAKPAKGQAPAAYMQPGPAKVFAEALLKPIGKNPTSIDFAAVATHAIVGAPAETGNGRFPVVLYSPGGSLPRTAGTVLVEDLVSRGYVVATIDHTYEAPAVAFPGDRVELAVAPTGEDRLKRMLNTRVADARFVVDQLEKLSRGANPDADKLTLPKGLGRALDLSHLGMFGHSAGGFASLEAMGEDRRIDAAANLDGSLAFSMSKAQYGPVVERGLDRPFLLMGAGVSGAERKPHTHQGAPDWSQLWNRSTGWKRDVHIARGEHMAYSDHIALLPQIANQLGLPAALAASSIGTAAPARVLNGERSYLAAFFDLHLKKRPQTLFGGPSLENPDFSLIE